MGKQDGQLISHDYGLSDHTDVCSMFDDSFSGCWAWSEKVGSENQQISISLNANICPKHQNL